MCHPPSNDKVRTAFPLFTCGGLIRNPQARGQTLHPKPSVLDLQMMREPMRLAGGRCLSSSASMATLSRWASTTMGRPPSLLLALHSSVTTGSTCAAQPPPVSP